MTCNPLKALLLAAIFLAGNLVLPGADVLLGHRLGQENETRVHLEPLGGCRNHAEHCVLPRLLNDLGQQSPSTAFVLASAPQQASPFRSADLPSAASRAPHRHHSRAPPAPLS
jgi:hypothetical protein